RLAGLHGRRRRDGAGREDAGIERTLRQRTNRRRAGREGLATTGVVRGGFAINHIRPDGLRRAVGLGERERAVGIVGGGGVTAQRGALIDALRSATTATAITGGRAASAATTAARVAFAVFLRGFLPPAGFFGAAV